MLLEKIKGFFTWVFDWFTYLVRG